MTKLFTWLSSALSDGYYPSATRTIAFITVPVTVILPLTIWAIISLHYMTPVDFPASLAGFIISVNTLILGTLHVNKREETKVETQVK